MVKKLSLFNEEQFSFFLDQNPLYSAQDLATLMNETFGLSLTGMQIRNFRRNHGLPSGRVTRFQKGNVPFNKDTKGICKPNRGSFKKGNVPVNKLPIGSERVTTDGYIRIKVQDEGGYNDRWKQKGRIVWESEHGPIPKGKLLMYLDGDGTNCKLDNLVLIDRKDRVRLNQMRYHFKNEDLNRAALGIVKLKNREVELRRGE